MKHSLTPTLTVPLIILAAAMVVPTWRAAAADTEEMRTPLLSFSPGQASSQGSGLGLGLGFAMLRVDGETGVRLPMDAGRLSFQPDSSPSAPPPTPATPSAADSLTKGPGGSDDAAELSKKLSNPVASLISVPFQFNYDTGYGPKDADRYQLNIQPVIPVSIAEDWNLITRTIVPVIQRDSPAEGIDDEFGMGDITQSFFFSPKEGELIWGVGPVFLWPTASSDELGGRKWGLGPTVVLLKQDKGWTYGVLANHIWSYAGESDHTTVNSSFLQPFLSYTFHTATSVTVNTESTYDWTEHQWTVPINLVLGQIVKLGSQLVQFQLGGRYYADSPDGGPEWGLRFGVTLLFPF